MRTWPILVLAVGGVTRLLSNYRHRRDKNLFQGGHSDRLQLLSELGLTECEQFSRRLDDLVGEFEEKDIPLDMRQAAVTENGSLVAGMMRYFELIWEYESVTDHAR